MAPSAQVRTTSRDTRVLEDLGSYRLLSVPQIAALHFPSRGASEARLRVLHQAELVLRIFMPARPYDRATHTIYGLAGKGARLLQASRGGELPRFLCASDHRSALFLDHTLRRNDLRICLEILARQDPGFQLLFWKQSPEDVRASAQVRISGRRSAQVPIIPDGAFALWHGGVVEGFAVEIDMGTVALKRMALRYRAYWTWWKGRGHVARYGAVPLRVLTLATTPRRLEALRQAALRAPTQGRGSGLFWFAKLDVADLDAPHRLLTGPWTTARREDPGEALPLIP